MADPNDTIQEQVSELEDSATPGNHALEVAARAGFGPLSSLAQNTWHGEGTPCVSCGQLVRRDDPACEQCGQDLSEEMIRKMRQHAGPWFVLEHVRPFPGVSLERVVRQIRRGLITETSIVRGPSNDYQWRFAVETPGLCRYFGKCWCCHGAVTLSDAYCPHCLHYLSFEKPRGSLQGPSLESEVAAPAASMAVSKSVPSVLPPAGATLADSVNAAMASRSQAGMGSSRTATTSTAAPSIGPSTPLPQSADLARLSAAVRGARVSNNRVDWDTPPRVGGVYVGWIAAFLIVGTVVTLLLISRARSDGPAVQSMPSLPVMPVPASTAPVSPATQPPIATAPAQSPPSSTPESAAPAAPQAAPTGSP